jgi:guanylate kinase
VSASQRRLGLLFVLVGPPGAGKNALMNEVLPQLPNLRQLPTATTRAIRPTEKQGREHLFVSRNEFEHMIANNLLIEHQEVHGQWYGIPRASVENAIDHEEDLIADIDVLGATYLRSIYPDNTVLIFIAPPSIEDLETRMRTRGETEDEIAKRMRRVKMEMEYLPECDYLILNEKLEESAETLKGIILAERSRRTLLNERNQRQLPRHKFAYMTLVIPACGEEVLCQIESPHFPLVPLAQGEYPHEAALRALEQSFDLHPHTENLYEAEPDEKWSSVILPIALETERHEHYQQFTFVYLYLMPERIPAPAGWAWTGYQELGLSGEVSRIIAEQRDRSLRSVEEC